MIKKADKKQDDMLIRLTVDRNRTDKKKRGDIDLSYLSEGDLAGSRALLLVLMRSRQDPPLSRRTLAEKLVGDSVRGEEKIAKATATALRTIERIESGSSLAVDQGFLRSLGSYFSSEELFLLPPTAVVNAIEQLGSLLAKQGEALGFGKKFGAVSDSAQGIARRFKDGCLHFEINTSERELSDRLLAGLYSSARWLLASSTPDFTKMALEQGLWTKLFQAQRQAKAQYKGRYRARRIYIVSDTTFPRSIVQDDPSETRLIGIAEASSVLKSWLTRNTISVPNDALSFVVVDNSLCGLTEGRQGDPSNPSRHRYSFRPEDVKRYVELHSDLWDAAT